jgi:hypothetical protein
MTNDDDLWPSDLVAEIPRTPMNILREQAAALGKRTNNIVQAKVKGYTDDANDFILEFNLFVPTLSNYKYTLFTIWHDEALYPVHFQQQTFEGEEDLRKWLRETFRSARVVKIVRALVAQARVTESDDDDLPL